TKPTMSAITISPATRIGSRTRCSPEWPRLSARTSSTSATSFVSRMASLPPGEGTAEDLTGQRAGVPAVAGQHGAVHDRGRDAARPLHEPPRAGGEIVDDLRHLRSNRFRIEDHEVGGHAFADEATVAKTPQRRRNQRQHAHGLLERERLLLPHPVTQ